MYHQSRELIKSLVLVLLAPVIYIHSFVSFSPLASSIIVCFCLFLCIFHAPPVLKARFPWRDDKLNWSLVVGIRWSVALIRIWRSLTWWAPSCSPCRAGTCGVWGWAWWPRPGSAARPAAPGRGRARRSGAGTRNKQTTTCHYGLCVDRFTQRTNLRHIYSFLTLIAQSISAQER